MASIVQRGGSYSVVYYTKENGIRKQKWESFCSEKDALHRKCMHYLSNSNLSQTAGLGYRHAAALNHL